MNLLDLIGRKRPLFDQDIRDQSAKLSEAVAGPHVIGSLAGTSGFIRDLARRAPIIGDLLGGGGATSKIQNNLIHSIFPDLARSYRRAQICSHGTQEETARDEAGGSTYGPEASSSKQALARHRGAA